MISPTAKPVIVSTFKGHETASFKIGTSEKAIAKSIRGLIDTLYSNKVRAVIRELWANALDSHIEAGKADVPFVCQLPNFLDANFIVRDFGVSLTHEQVMNLYVTIFESTKDESNDFTGQWGLGSKVFYALTDHAQVTVWKDGECRVYAAHMTFTGVPEIMHLSTVPSDEPQGLEVSFAVEEHRWVEFLHEAQEVAYGFPVPPDTGGVELASHDIILGEENWSIYKGPHAIRQGCVLYPVQNHQVGYQLPSALQPGYGFLVDVPMGSVEVTLSREALSFSDTTRQVVIGLFKEASTNLMGFIQKKIDGSKNRLAAEKELVKWSRYIQTSTADFKFGDYELKGIISFLKDREIPEFVTPSKQEPVKPRFNIRNIETMEIIVDRGQQIIRKATRLRAYAKGRQGSTTVILRNPSSDVLERLVRRLGLRADQLVPITTIPDAKTDYSNTSNAISGTTARSGLYQFKHGDLYRVDDDSIPEDYIWHPIVKAVKSANVDFCFREGSPTTQKVSELTWVLTLARQFGIHEEFFMMTPAAVKRIKPNDENRLDILLQQAFNEAQEDILEYYRVQAVYENVKNFHMIREAIGVERVPAHPAIGTSMFGSLLTQEFYEAQRQQIDLGAATAEELRIKYPLVFSLNPEDEHFTDYITTINNQNNESVEES